MSLKIYNSLTRKKETFEPLEKGKVGMYVCGITPYDECHLGHARAAVVFDVIYRYLKYLGYHVTYVRNFTDVDDKIIKKANDTGALWSDVAEKYIRSYKEQMDFLGVRTPTSEPRATQNIDAMIRLIEKLTEQELAYPVDGDVYFAVRKFRDYGRLSHKKIDELAVGARIEVSEKKKDPLDFALWKGVKPGEPFWDSPWGKGRPGWHIECSAMSLKYLGESSGVFDIHGGGRDLMFPHHENEIAQSEGATGRKPFARFWIHNGFVNIHAEKMSKSLGNIRSILGVLKQWDSEIIRYFLLSAHYASPLDFTDQALTNVQEALTRYYETLLRLDQSSPGEETSVGVGFQKILEKGLDDDFNTTVVIGAVFDFVRQINRTLDRGKGFHPRVKTEIQEGVRLIGDVLGVFGSNPAEFFQKLRKKSMNQSSLSEQDILSLIDERKKVRLAKDWKRSDEIRKELASQGVILKDNSDGTTTWEMKHD